MKVFTTLTLGILVMCSLALAEDEHHHAMGSMHGHDHGACLNNVVSVDADGSKTALCGCGMEFTVTDKTPSMDVDGMTVYACSEGCATKMAGMDDMMKAGKMNELKMACEMNKHLVTNSSMKDGKQMATCACGVEFEVSDSSPFVVENGVKTYVCSDECKAHFSEAPADMRAKVQMMTRSEKMNK